MEETRKWVVYPCEFVKAKNWKEKDTKEWKNEKQVTALWCCELSCHSGHWHPSLKRLIQSGFLLEEQVSQPWGPAALMGDLEEVQASGSGLLHPGHLEREAAKTCLSNSAFPRNLSFKMDKHSSIYLNYSLLGWFFVLFCFVFEKFTFPLNNSCLQEWIEGTRRRAWISESVASTLHFWL